MTVFFFSSRRRHTRFDCDWSSDVCSSDLTPQFRQAFGYVWKRADFPWLGIWEENCSRQASPWDGKTVTRGMEFGASPFPQTRREMVDRNRVLDAAAYKWIASRGRLDAEYWIS